MNNFDPGLWDELCLALSACQLVVCLYTLCCSGPVGRLATVSLIACCVRTVRLTSLAGGPFLLDSHRHTAAIRQLAAVGCTFALQESADRRRGLILHSYKTCTLLRTQQLPLSVPAGQQEPTFVSHGALLHGVAGHAAVHL